MIKKITFGLFAVLALAVAVIAGTNAEVDKQAPDFTLSDSHGKKHSLSEFKGKYVVLEWVNYDCPFVVKHYNSNNMQNLQKEYTSKGVIWLSICSSADGKQGNFTIDQINEKYKERAAASTAYLIDADGAVGKMYGAKTTPNMYVISPEGKIIYAGAIDDKPSADAADIPAAKNYIKTALDEAMAGKAVTTKSTKPYGCSVKYVN